MSFGESMISAGYIQKTVKEDLRVRVNYANPPRNRRGKDLEDIRGHHTEAEPEGLPGGATRPPAFAARPPVGPIYQQLP
jgi:hypothetical protein